MTTFEIPLVYVQFHILIISLDSTRATNDSMNVGQVRTMSNALVNQPKNLREYSSDPCKKKMYLENWSTSAADFSRAEQYLGMFDSESD